MLLEYNKGVDIPAELTFIATEHLRLTREGKIEERERRASQNTWRLKEIIEERGHFLSEEDPFEVSFAQWLIAYNANKDPKFQDDALDWMERAEGQVYPPTLAYMRDRVAVNHGRPQIYGTLNEGEVVDIDRLMERRLSMGLSSSEGIMYPLNYPQEIEFGQPYIG